MLFLHAHTEPVSNQCWHLLCCSCTTLSPGVAGAPPALLATPRLQGAAARSHVDPLSPRGVSERCGWGSRLVVSRSLGYSSVLSTAEVSLLEFAVSLFLGR